MALTAGINETLKVPFYVTDVDGISPLTGLTNASFTKVLIREDALSAQALTVSEIGSGYYYAEFVPDQNGLWYATVLTPAQDLFACDVLVGEYDLLDAVAVLRKAAINRLEVNLSTQELVLYDDDGATIKQRWPLETEVGPPGDVVTTQPGVQTKRKAPLL